MAGLSTFFIYALISTFTPGPNNIMSMSNGIRFGMSKTMSFILGTVFGSCVNVGLTTILCYTLFNFIPTIKPFMLVFGCSYLLWLAYKVYTFNPMQEAKSKECSFIAGFILQTINIKLTILALTSLSLYILPNYHSIFLLLLFILFLVGISFVGSVVWAGFGSLFMNLFHKHYKIINPIMALMLVYCAIAIFF